MFERLFSEGRLTFERLRTLVEIDHAGSISKAAPNDLNRQSQYSRQLKEIEGFFRTELATREGRRLELNDEGHRLAEIGLKILKMLDEFYSERLDLPVHITLGSYDSLIHWQLAGRMGVIQSNSRKVECRLKAQTTKEIIDGLLDFDLDFGLVRQTALKSPLKSHPLFKMQYSLLVARDKVPAGHSHETVWILKNVTLALNESAKDFKDALAAGTKMKSLPVQLRCETAVQASRAVLSGHYCSILPDIALSEFDEEKYIRLPAPLPANYERRICLAWNPRLLKMRESLRPVKDLFIKALK